MSNHDDKLAQLLADLSDRAHRGEVIDIQSIGCQYPEYAAELQELWGAAMLADAEMTQIELGLQSSGVPEDGLSEREVDDFLIVTEVRSSIL